MTTKATDWVWEKVVHPADDKVATFQDAFATTASKPYGPVMDQTARPFRWTRDQLYDANRTAIDGIRSVHRRLPHPMRHARTVWDRESRTMRFVGLLGECSGMAATRFVGNVGCGISHVARVAVKCVAYAAVGVPQTALLATIGAAWLATVAVPYVVIGVVARAPMYLAGAAATVVLETPPLVLRTAGLTWRFVTGAFAKAWNGSSVAQAKTVEGKSSKQGEVELKGKAKSELRRNGTESREAAPRSWRPKMIRKAPEASKAPERGGLGE